MSQNVVPKLTEETIEKDAEIQDLKDLIQKQVEAIKKLQKRLEKAKEIYDEREEELKELRQQLEMYGSIYSISGIDISTDGITGIPISDWDTTISTRPLPFEATSGGCSYSNNSSSHYSSVDDKIRRTFLEKEDK